MRGAPRRGLAWARQAWWIELITVFFGYFVYELIQGAAPARRSLAFANARTLVDVQKWLHIDIDSAVNHFVNRHDGLAVIAGYYYDTLHYVVTPAVLLWVYLCRPAVYGRWRSALIGSSVAALVVFWVLPMAPPRFVVRGIRDTLVEHHIFGTVATNGNPPTLVNDVAAMPSLHVGWALWCAATIVGTTTVRWRYLAYLYPVATTLVVLGTGNHYILDAAGGLTMLGIGLLVTAAPWRERVEPGPPPPSVVESAAAVEPVGAEWTAREPERPPEADALRRTRRIDAQVPTTSAPTGISAR